MNRYAIIVTRHASLVSVLAEDFGIFPDGEVISHATAAAVRGKDVVGVLPLHLASEASTITEVSLDLPPELRGKELTANEVRQHLKGLTTYRVEKIG